MTRCTLWGSEDHIILWGLLSSKYIQVLAWYLGVDNVGMVNTNYPEALVGISPKVNWLN